METDGTKKGFDLEITAAISERVGIPVIASVVLGPSTIFMRDLPAARLMPALQRAPSTMGNLQFGMLRSIFAHGGSRYGCEIEFKRSYRVFNLKSIQYRWVNFAKYPGFSPLND
jgi:hypothetical protein